MNRHEFETEFFKDSEDGRNCRFGHIMLALARGPSWQAWSAAPGNTPSYFNDVCFAALYWDFNRHPTRKRMVQIRDFAWARNATDKGFMINPASAGSETRTKFKSYMAEISTDWNKQKGLGTQQGHEDSSYVAYHAWGSKEEKHSELGGQIRAIYSQMWLPGGSMKDYLTNLVGAMSHGNVVQQAAANLLQAFGDDSKKAWLTSLVSRFSGTSSTSARFGMTFDVDDFGLLRNKFKNLLSGRVMIGNRRGHVNQN